MGTVALSLSTVITSGWPSFSPRRQEIDLNEHVLDLDIQNGTMIVKIKCNNQGATASPFVIYAGLLGMEIDPTKIDEAARRFLIAKIGIEW